VSTVSCEYIASEHYINVHQGLSIPCAYISNVVCTGNLELRVTMAWLSWSLSPLKALSLSLVNLVAFHNELPSDLCERAFRRGGGGHPGEP
jgi:hypothetical protein